MHCDFSHTKPITRSKNHNLLLLVLQYGGDVVFPTNIIPASQWVISFAVMQWVSHRPETTHPNTAPATPTPTAAYNDSTAQFVVAEKPNVCCITSRTHLISAWKLHYWCVCVWENRSAWKMCRRCPDHKTDICLYVPFCIVFVLLGSVQVVSGIYYLISIPVLKLIINIGIGCWVR